MVYKLNYLGNTPQARVKKMIRAIPTEETSVDLSGNELHKKTGLELAETFRLLPRSILFLDLTWNNFYEMTTQDFVKALAAISAPLLSLNLSWNNLSKATVVELIQIIKAIPITVIHLYLNGNHFFQKTTTDLAQVFAALSENISEITLSLTDIEKRSESELIILAKALPHVLKVNIISAVDGQRMESHPAILLLKKHIGTWIKGTNALLEEQLPPEIAKLTLAFCSSTSRDGSLKDIATFIDAHKAEERRRFQLSCCENLRDISDLSFILSLYALRFRPRPPAIERGIDLMAFGIVGKLIAEHGLFKLKASENHLTQPAISLQI